jgi:hypothetical protein
MSKRDYRNIRNWFLMEKQIYQRYGIFEQAVEFESGEDTGGPKEDSRSSRGVSILERNNA